MVGVDIAPYLAFNSWLYRYGRTFVCDMFNVFDIVVIWVSFIVGILCVSGSASAAQRITPILRLLRIILVRMGIRGLL